MNYNSSYYSLLFPLLSLFLAISTISHYFDYFPLFLVTISLKNMENNLESKEPTSSEIESKEREIADGSGERKEVVATAADSEKEEILKKETKIEQRPFLTQSELLVKMKAGEEEEVKRCQKPEFFKFVSTIMIFRSALEGSCVACLRMASQYIATGFNHSHLQSWRRPSRPSSLRCQL